MGKEVASVSQEFQPKTRLFEAIVVWWTRWKIIIMNVSRWSALEAKFLVRGV
jgi:hypothetical protein